VKEARYCSLANAAGGIQVSASLENRLSRRYPDNFTRHGLANETDVKILKVAKAQGRLSIGDIVDTSRNMLKNKNVAYTVA
jgi:predicted nuclease of predicted toxin-antitoxin system